MAPTKLFFKSKCERSVILLCIYFYYMKSNQRKDTEENWYCTEVTWASNINNNIFADNNNCILQTVIPLACLMIYTDHL